MTFTVGTPHIFLIAVAMIAAACSSPASPAGQAAGAVSITAIETDAPQLPQWIAEPAVLPAGLHGQNNCKFGFGNTTIQWDFHPDGACWERPGPDGWTRNQQHRVHATSVAACGGGPGDVSPIRVCREGGPEQPGPSAACETPTTGPLGCIICVRSVSCH